MKVIDLINKIHEETQPSHIRFNNEDWYWNDYDGYVTKESLKTTPDAQIYLHDRYILMFALDKEVEIIEEDKKIEKLPYYSLERIQKAPTKDTWFDERVSLLEKRADDCHEKINEIIDYLESEVN